MTHIERFKTESQLIEKYGEEKAYLVWVLAMYLDFPDIYQLATESLTDGNDDKKIDFIRLDSDVKKLTIVQGAYAKNNAFYKAKSNKASDLNTALAWLISGDINKLRTDSNSFENSIREYAIDIRKALEDSEIDEIEILYVHNLAESKNVEDELETVKSHLQKIINDENVIVICREIGFERIERIFRLKEANIIIEDRIKIPSKAKYIEEGPSWKAGVFTVTGLWLKKQFDDFGDSLFSANYRGFLGISKRGRKKINSGIRSTAENQPENFWAFNNGITILTSKLDLDNPDETYIEGISIINGAQTTGSIGHSDISKLSNVNVLCRIIEAKNEDTINSIIEFNNTQNEIKTWDRFSKFPEQEKLSKEFKTLGYDYSFKRGFGSIAAGLSLEVVAQPVSALHGNYLEAGGGKNNIFEKNSLYEDAFQNIKAKHLLLAYCLLKAIDDRRFDLKIKNENEKSTTDEQKQLSLLRHLRFKYFLLSVIGSCFENIVGEAIDIRNIAFANGVASNSVNTIDKLVSYCKPIVTAVLTYTAKCLTNDFSEIMYDKAEYEKIKTSVSNAIDGIKMIQEDNVFTEFAKLIAPKG